MEKHCQSSIGNDTDYMEEGHIYLPRKITRLMYSKTRSEQRFYRLFGALINFCFYEDGVIKYNDEPVFCKRGECITSCRELALRTDIPFTSIGKLLLKLQHKGLIEIIPEKNYSRIRVKNYLRLTGQRKRRKTEPLAEPKPGAGYVAGDLPSPGTLTMISQWKQKHNIR